MAVIDVSLISIPTINLVSINIYKLRSYFPKRGIWITRKGEIFMTAKWLGEMFYQLEISSQEETCSEAKVASTNETTITMDAWTSRVFTSSNSKNCTVSFSIVKIDIQNGPAQTKSTCSTPKPKQLHNKMLTQKKRMMCFFRMVCTVF